MAVTINERGRWIAALMALIIAAFFLWARATEPAFPRALIAWSAGVFVPMLGLGLLGSLRARTACGMSLGREVAGSTCGAAGVSLWLLAHVTMRDAPSVSRYILGAGAVLLMVFSLLQLTHRVLFVLTTVLLAAVFLFT